MPFRPSTSAASTQFSCRQFVCAPCADDWRRRNGRPEPLRWFLVTERPACALVLAVTVLASVYYAGQHDELPRDAVVATAFDWGDGCGTAFGPYADTSAYHTRVIWAPTFTLLASLALALPVRCLWRGPGQPFDACCQRCGGARPEERTKVARGWFTCILVLCSGLNFLLAPVLSFGWSSNLVCRANATCRARMEAVYNGSAAGKVCCADFAAGTHVPGGSWTSTCNVAAFRILFVVTSVVFPFAIALLFTTALREKSRRQRGGALMSYSVQGGGHQMDGEGEDVAEDEDEEEEEESSSEDEAAKAADQLAQDVGVMTAVRPVTATKTKKKKKKKKRNVRYGTKGRN